MEKQQPLFESIFHGAPLKSAAEKLEGITKKYPYFSLAHFYLLHLLPPHTAARKLQARKAAALFNNAHWLNFQLTQLHENEAASAAADFFKNEPTTSSLPDTPLAPLVAAMEPTVEPPAEEASSTLEVPDVQTAGAGEAVFNTVPESSAPAADIEVDNTIGSVSKSIEVADTSPVEMPVADSTDVLTSSSNLPEETTTSSTAVGESGSIPLVPEDAAAHPVEQDVSEPDAISIMPQPIPAIKQAPGFNDSDAQLLFEPLHTTDYFASLGIRISDEVKPSDKLGKQLKSFTEWLKTMKKIHAEQQQNATSATEENSTVVESTILELAENSNKEAPVLTEAMADVLIQQGRYKKAVTLLQKLSLLNPDKSAYFAAKINQLKEL